MFLKHSGIIFFFSKRTFQKNIHIVLFEYYYEDTRVKDARLKTPKQTNNKKTPPSKKPQPNQPKPFPHSKKTRKEKQEEETLKQASGKLQLSKPKAMTKNS